MPAQLLVLRHPGGQDDPNHIWLQERLHAAAGRV